MNNYHVNDEIAKGNSCIVYKARKKKSIDYYAIKSLEKFRREKLMNEVKIWPQLEHTNIIRFYNWYETKNHLWAIYEYSPGGNLHSLIQQDKRLTEAGVKPFLKDLIQGLHYMHSKGVIYCDLKPSNVLLNEYGTLKYCDFGLARLSINLIQSEQEVREGSKKGTPSYMAPELFEEDGVYSMQSDLWSLGCVLHEMVTGSPPFTSNSLSDLIWQILNKEIVDVAGFSPEFHAILRSLLAKNPIHRPSWNQLLSNPYFDWSGQQRMQLISIPIPSQPHFDRWANKKYPELVSESSSSSSSSSLSPFSEQLHQQPTREKHVNILRLSLNARKNESAINSSLNGIQNNNNNNNNNSNNNNFQPDSAYQLQSSQLSRHQKGAHSTADFLLQNQNQIIDIGGNHSNQTNTASTSDIFDQSSMISNNNTMRIHLDESSLVSNTLTQQSAVPPQIRSNLSNHSNSQQQQQQNQLTEQQQQQQTSDNNKSAAVAPARVAAVNCLNSPSDQQSRHQQFLSPGANAIATATLATAAASAVACAGDTGSSNKQPMSSRSRLAQPLGQQQQQPSYSPNSHQQSQQQQVRTPTSTTKLMSNMRTQSNGSTINNIQTIQQQHPQQQQHIIKVNTLVRTPSTPNHAGIPAATTEYCSNESSRNLNNISSTTHGKSVSPNQKQSQLIRTPTSSTNVLKNTSNLYNIHNGMQSQNHHNKSPSSHSASTQQQQQQQHSSRKSPSSTANVNNVTGVTLQQQQSSTYHVKNKSSTGTTSNLLYNMNPSNNQNISPVQQAYQLPSHSNNQHQNHHYYNLPSSSSQLQQHNSSQQSVSPIRLISTKKNSISNTNLTAGEITPKSLHHATPSALTTALTKEESANKSFVVQYNNLMPNTSQIQIAPTATITLSGGVTSTPTRHTSSSTGLNASPLTDGLDKLLIHNSDIQVKPIIGHKDIEKNSANGAQETTTAVLFHRESLPFTSYNVEDVEKSCQSPEIEGLFQDLFQYLQGFLKSGVIAQIQQQQQQMNTTNTNSSPIQQSLSAMVASCVNVLAYFEKIVQNSAVANRLINSAFINLLAEVLVSVNNCVPQIRLRVATSIGFLLRFANSIENSLTQLNLSFVLIQVINTEHDHKVRRKLMAALGEYLFYAATQMDENPSGSVWRIANGVLQFVVRTMRNPEEDELVRFYACKTIENIASQAQSMSVGGTIGKSSSAMTPASPAAAAATTTTTSNNSMLYVGIGTQSPGSNNNNNNNNSSAAEYFCSEESINGLASIFLHSKNEEFRTSALVSLCQVQRIRIDLSVEIIHTLGGASSLKDLLRSENNSNVSNRIQQAALTMINSHLFYYSCNNSSGSSNTGSTYSNYSTDNSTSAIAMLTTNEFLESSFFEVVTRLLESPHAMIRAKSILMLSIAIQASLKHLAVLATSTKFFTLVEKLTRDNFKYVQQCFAKLKVILVNVVPLCLTAIAEEVNRILVNEEAAATTTLNSSPFDQYMLKNNKQQQTNRHQTTVPILQGNLQLMQVLIKYADNALLKSVVFSESILNTTLQVFIIVQQAVTTSSSSNACMILNEAKSVMINYYEVLLLNTNHLMDNSEFFLQHLVPALMSLLEKSLQSKKQVGGVMLRDSSSSSEKDLQFSYLKLIQEITSILILEYVKQQQQSIGLQQLNELFVSKFVCSLLQLILCSAENGSLSVIALKLLQTLVESQPVLYINVLKQCGMLNVLLAQFNESSSRSTLRLVARIVQVLSLNEIQSFGIPHTAVSLFAHFVNKQLDQCYEDMLDICIAIATKITAVQPLNNLEKPCAFEYSIDHSFDMLLVAYNLCYSLLGNIDATISEKATTFIVHTIYIYARQSRVNAQVAAILMKSESIFTLLNFLLQFLKVESISKRLLRILLWIAMSPMVIPKEIRMPLFQQLESLAAINAADVKFVTLLRSILNALMNKSLLS